MDSVKRKPVKGSLDLIEEAVHLLRSSSAGTLATYMIGSFPFILGFLYFWVDMSRSPFAQRHCAEAALSMSVLYVWMKCWQSIFCSQLRGSLTGRPPPIYNLRRIGRLVMIQLALQPHQFLVLPFSVLLLFPLGWTYALYHNICVFGDGREGDIGQVLRKSWRQALLWPGQNHALISLLWIFALVIYLNVFVTILFVPSLIHSLFGIETFFTLGGWSPANTTFLSVIWGISYLFVNPLIKTCYVLRCFYGESLRSGADLIAELNTFMQKSDQTLIAES